MITVEGKMVPEIHDQIFSDRDVSASPNVLSRLMRKLFVSKKITYDDFKTSHMAHMDRLNATSNSSAYAWNNLKKAIVKPKITWQMLSYVLESILQLHIINISITVVDKSNNTEKYSLDL